MAEEINYDALKKRGFLRQKHEGFFILRARRPCGNFQAADFRKLAIISDEFGRGVLHATTRQGIEIPYVKYEDIDRLEKIIREAGFETGTSGPRLRTTTCCPGNNWCKSGLVDTSVIYRRIEDELGIRCAMDLPHKFKIAISGCPNTCTRAQQSEIGLHGSIDVSSPEKKIGYTVYLGGCGGRTPRMGFKLEKTYSEDEVLKIVGRVVTFFKQNAKPRQRLALLIEEYGKDRFINEVLNGL